ncbi:hypothetical protein MKY19_07075 [Paenibacillus sp. FSL R5-0744]|uniref:hypothetical protein n=1 Tax=Paenibacillus sp. FSL R5-0744 TaxID=2921656 RepID=UPI0030DAE1CD
MIVASVGGYLQFSIYRIRVAAFNISYPAIYLLWNQNFIFDSNYKSGDDLKNGMMFHCLLSIIIRMERLRWQ